MKSSLNAEVMVSRQEATLLRLRPLIGLIARQVAEEDVRRQNAVTDITAACSDRPATTLELPA
jgi:hypothetical protein